MARHSHRLRTFTTSYPGAGALADYVSLSLKTGSIAIYTLYDAGPLRPADLGLIHDDQYIRNTAFFTHVFRTFLANGEKWQSPTIRIRIGQSGPETISSFALDHGFTQFPSLEQKPGSAYKRVVESPLVKGDSLCLGIPFSRYPEIFAEIARYSRLLQIEQAITLGM